MSTNKLLVILGQTATGKTNLAIAIAKKYNGEIICADSRTIYKHMDIGTAKPTKIEMQGIKHYLIDVVEPDEKFSVVQFKTLCLKYIDKIRQRGRLPIIVGGTGLYLDSVLFDYGFRNKQGFDVTGLSDAEKLIKAKQLYPEASRQIDSKNILRIEQLLMRGPSNNADRDKLKIDCKIIGLSIEKPLLKQNIAKRTKQMLNNGFVQEVINIRKKYGADCPALMTTGYRQVCEYLDGSIEKEDLEAEIIKATLALAKKQATWFKRNPYIEWAESKQGAVGIADKYLGQV